MFGSEGRHFDLTARGYHVLYREREVNHCPGCGRTHWYVGRMSAECGFCGTALPLSECTAEPPSILMVRRSNGHWNSAFAA